MQNNHSIPPKWSWAIFILADLKPYQRDVQFFCPADRLQPNILRVGLRLYHVFFLDYGAVAELAL